MSRGLPSPKSWIEIVQNGPFQVFPRVDTPPSGLVFKIHRTPSTLAVTERKGRGLSTEQITNKCWRLPTCSSDRQNAGSSKRSRPRLTIAKQFGPKLPRRARLAIPKAGARRPQKGAQTSVHKIEAPSKKSCKVSRSSRCESSRLPPIPQIRSSFTAGISHTGPVQSPYPGKLPGLTPPKQSPPPETSSQEKQAPKSQTFSSANGRERKKRP